MDREFILKRIDLAIHELNHQKLLSGRTLKAVISNVLMKEDKAMEPPKLAPRKNAGPPVVRPHSFASNVEENRETSRPQSTNGAQTQIYSLETSQNKNSNLANTTKIREHTKIPEKPDVPKRVPYTAPINTTKAQSSIHPVASIASNYQAENKASSPVKPPLPSKPAPSLKETSKVGLEDMNLTLDKTMIHGSKPPTGVAYKVDPEAARKAGNTMRDSGATKELVPGLRLNNNPPPSVPSTASKPIKRVPIYKAVRAFAAEQEGDLPLKIGDYITSIEEVDANWFAGEVNGRKGIFPKNFVVAEIE